jgi:hypothetical protein
MDVRDLYGNLLIRLRNPWGVKDWAGPFADHSKGWPTPRELPRRVHGALRVPHPANILAAVIEKAYAKLFGCYENLTGGSIAGGITDLTGGMVERVVLRERPPWTSRPSTTSSPP